MADIKWIKITTDIFDDDKILLIESLPDADAIIVIWFKLLCLAGKQNNSGVFLLNDRIPYTDKMLATIFRRKESTVQLALNTFQQFGMIEVVDGVITIPNWGKHQNLDALEKKTAYMRDYMRDYRQKQKQLAASSQSEANCKSNSRTNVSRLESESDIEEESESENHPPITPLNKPKKKQKAFVPPTLEDVQKYVSERNSSVDPKAFWEYYDAGSWKDSRGEPVRNWKQKLLTWEKRDKKNAMQPQYGTRANKQDYEGSKDFFDD